jgi:hypothetical protein
MIHQCKEEVLGGGWGGGGENKTKEKCI